MQPTEGDGEIARLGRALNGMLTQIETAFAQRARSEDRLRSFLADASHELRTPADLDPGLCRAAAQGRLGGPGGTGTGPCPASRRRRPGWARWSATWPSWPARDEGPEPARYRVDLAAVAAEAVADAKTIDAARPSSSRASAEVPVSGDDARLEQMVHNLLGNALAHTPAGTPVEVGVAVRGGAAVLEVRDQGPGMSPRPGRHVFDRFYRGDGDRIDGGSGLGLFIVATLARTFGGTATVDTELGRGSTFRVVLPVRIGRRPGSDRTAMGRGSRRGCWPRLTGDRARRSLLLHGQPGSGASWDPVTERLEPRVPGAGPRPDRLRGLDR